MFCEVTVGLTDSSSASDHTAFRYRLYPTPAQGAAFSRWAGCARAVYNTALEQRRLAWRMHRQRVHWAAQDAELCDLKQAFPWLAEPHADVLQQALRDLDGAFRSFFVGRARHPRPRRKGRHESFRIQQRRRGGIGVKRLSRRWGAVRIPKLGWVRFRWTREPSGKIKHVTVRREALGWHVSFCCQMEIRKASPPPGPPVGVDRGVVASLALSNGELHSVPGLRNRERERLLRLQRRRERQEQGSKRRERTCRAIAQLRAREARRRRDRLHKLSQSLATFHETVVIERLRVGAMTRSAHGTRNAPGHNVRAKAGLNRAILSQGWGDFRRMLAYKITRSGGRLVEVHPAYTSQTCARCGLRDPASRWSRSSFHCVACGHAAHADVNAAKNILAAGLGRVSAWSPLRWHGDEARTIPGWTTLHRAVDPAEIPRTCPLGGGQPRSSDISSTSMGSRRRYIATMIPRPITTSQAAITITISAKT